MTESEIFGGMIPENLLYYKPVPRTLCWHTPEQQVTTLYSDARIGNALRWVPKMIWIARESDLRVFAFKELSGEKTELFEAPFPNISSGSVCLGSGAKAYKSNKHDTYKGFMQYVERWFWQTVFTHAPDGCVKGDYYEIMEFTKTNPFPEHELVKENRKLGRTLDAGLL